MRNEQLFFKNIDVVIKRNNKLFKKLNNSTILVTGATGLIGFTLISILLRYNQIYKGNVNIIANIRNPKKAKEKFNIFKNQSKLSFYKNDIKNKFKIKQKIDYIIHTAASTSSLNFINNPIDVIDTAITGTRNLLELAKEKKIKSFVYLSSMEIYGIYKKELLIDELSPSYIDISNPRSSYPESKRICEILSVSYLKQHLVPSKIIRLCQVIGPGISDDDNRLPAYFAKCTRTNKDIILKTKGEAKRNYISTLDAGIGIFTVLLNGENGGIYNLADQNSYYSVVQLAKIFEKLSKHTKIKFEIDDINKLGYINERYYYKLNCEKIINLGWKPLFNVKTISKILIDSL